MQVLVDLMARWFDGVLLRLCPGKLRGNCTPLEELGTVGQHSHARHVHAMWSLCTPLYTCQNCAAIKIDEQNTATNINRLCMPCLAQTCLLCGQHKLQER